MTAKDAQLGCPIAPAEAAFATTLACRRCCRRGPIHRVLANSSRPIDARSMQLRLKEPRVGANRSGTIRQSQRPRLDEYTALAAAAYCAVRILMRLLLDKGADPRAASHSADANRLDAS
jgi:hypothetical protein